MKTLVTLVAATFLSLAVLNVSHADDSSQSRTGAVRGSRPQQGGRRGDLVQSHQGCRQDCLSGAQHWQDACRKAALRGLPRVRGVACRPTRVNEPVLNDYVVSRMGQKKTPAKVASR